MGDESASRKSILTDMDGVLVRGRAVIPGAREFIERLTSEGRPYLVLTNNSTYPPAILQHRLRRLGREIPVDCFHTSAVATAQFLQAQRPRGTAFVVGEDGIHEALEDIGYTFTDREPDYVVLGETTDYAYERIARAMRLIASGARFIATNPDPSGPSEDGIAPATGAIAALIERASGVAPYAIGKPNPLMLRTALHRLGEHSGNAIMVGDRMDTDILTGIESGLETVLVLTGVTARDGPSLPVPANADRRVGRRPALRCGVPGGGASLGQLHGSSREIPREGRYKGEMSGRHRPPAGGRHLRWCCPVGRGGVAMVFAPRYFLFMIPGLLLMLLAQWRLQSAYARFRAIPISPGMTRAQAAAAVLRYAGVDDVGIEAYPGELTDHVDPRARMPRLSVAVYSGRSIAALAAAAHEAGHAVQQHVGYLPLTARTALVPVVNFGSNFGFPVLFGGLLLNSPALAWAGVLLFGTATLFALAALPVGYDASARARALLSRSGLITRGEEGGVADMLNAAALTYVASFAASLLTLRYYAMLASGVSRREE